MQASECLSAHFPIYYNGILLNFMGFKVISLADILKDFIKNSLSNSDITRSSHSLFVNSK